MEQDVEDGKFSKPARHDGADVEEPVVQKALAEMFGIHRRQVVANAVASGQHEEDVRNETDYLSPSF